VGLKIAVLANFKQNAPAHPGMPPDAWAELDTQSTTDAIVAALQAAGHAAVVLEGGLSMVEQLLLVAPDICFNICEGHGGDSRESHVPAILEMLRIPYTGSGVLTLAVTLDKPLTKRVLDYHGLPTPDFQVFQHADGPVRPDLTYPLFVKPSREGSSLGVTAASIVTNERELRSQVAQQLVRFQQPILVERFVRGREVTVGVVGNVAGKRLGDWAVRTGPGGGVPGGLRVLPPLEVYVEKYDAGRSGVYVGRIKSDPGDEYHYSCPADLPSTLSAELRSLAASAFDLTGCRDVARVDFRLDADDGDRPYVLEVNALPGLSPGYSDLVLAAEAVGIAYPDLITSIVDHACSRYGLTKQWPD
jgi:D-alanine-D-alanine ligase